MKLYHSPTSPFVRIVHIAALEKGIMDQIDFIPARAPGAGLDGLNPLDKIPTLITDDGETLIESRLIALYIDGLGTPRLYPTEPAARRRVLQQEAIVLGIMVYSFLQMMLNGGELHGVRILAQKRSSS